MRAWERRIWEPWGPWEPRAYRQAFARSPAWEQPWGPQPWQHSRNRQQTLSDPPSPPWRRNATNEMTNEKRTRSCLADCLKHGFTSRCIVYGDEGKWLGFTYNSFYLDFAFFPKREESPQIGPFFLFSRIPLCRSVHEEMGVPQHRRRVLSLDLASFALNATDWCTITTSVR